MLVAVPRTLRDYLAKPLSRSPCRRASRILRPYRLSRRHRRGGPAPERPLWLERGGPHQRLLRRRVRRPRASRRADSPRTRHFWDPTSALVSARRTVSRTNRSPLARPRLRRHEHPGRGLGLRRPGDAHARLARRAARPRRPGVMRRALDVPPGCASRGASFLRRRHRRSLGRRGPDAGERAIAHWLFSTAPRMPERPPGAGVERPDRGGARFAAIRRALSAARGRRGVRARPQAYANGARAPHRARPDRNLVRQLPPIRSAAFSHSDPRGRRATEALIDMHPHHHVAAERAGLAFETLDRVFRVGV